MATYVHNKSKMLPESPCFRLEVAAGVIFGTPSKQCAGNGICMITKPDAASLLSAHCQLFLVMITLLADGHLSFRFPKSGLNVAAYPHFQSGFLLVEEPFVIPRWILRAWGKPRTRIPPGRYAVRESPDAWTLIF